VKQTTVLIGRCSLVVVSKVVNAMSLQSFSSIINLRSAATNVHCFVINLQVTSVRTAVFTFVNFYIFYHYYISVTVFYLSIAMYNA